MSTNLMGKHMRKMAALALFEVQEKGIQLNPIPRKYPQISFHLC